MTLSNPNLLRVCFSYAAYAKNLINHLHSSNIPVEPGLSDEEFSAVESSFNFKFPPDLRSILQEGLPVGPGFPNWRCSSKQQLDILTNLPILGICKEVSRNGLWPDYWGEKPNDIDRALKLAKGLLKKAPVLVPIYRHFYMPTTPFMAGNPVFYVHGKVVRMWSFDIARFFQRLEFGSSSLFASPVWAAKEARAIEFWMELAGNSAARRSWWCGDLGGCLEEVCWRLRDGGWKEEDVREMMMMDGCDEFDHDCGESLDMGWRVRILSGRLLRAGWSTEDVVELLGSPEDCNLDDGGESCFDIC
ncbi:hypothetical protein ACJIZ3_003670 [Penstemon smallii]|uniref:Knr4/Smi1-like domain-containing protein n=1 Tax=Penstemon smallii TaxID=265156 RepID=A0ABD3UB75_9LAMI